MERIHGIQRQAGLFVTLIRLHEFRPVVSRIVVVVVHKVINDKWQWKN